MANHNTVAHHWANQTGRACKGLNMYYEGRTLYSYGSHFPIARITQDAHGETVVLFTGRSYSISTAKHKSIAARACSHLPTFTVEHVLAADHHANREGMIFAAQEAVKRAKRARVRGAEHLRSAQWWLDEANDYARRFAMDVEPVTFETLGVAFEAIAARIAAACLAGIESI